MFIRIRKIHRLLQGLLVAVLCCVVSQCGHMGPLMLPDHKPNQTNVIAAQANTVVTAQ